MFERFTDRSRQVVVLAQTEAKGLGHDFIGTEHLLLGMLSEGQGVAAQVLTALNLDLPTARQQVDDLLGPDCKKQSPPTHLPFTPRAKKVLDYALREALQLGHTFIGTEHLLLGLLREGEGLGCQIITEAGIELVLVRQSVVKMLTDGQPISLSTPDSESHESEEPQRRELQLDIIGGMYEAPLAALEAAAAVFAASPEQLAAVRRVLLDG